MSCGIIPCVTVNTGTVTLIEQFGKYTKIANPGLNIVIPCCCEFPAATVTPALTLSLTLSLTLTRPPRALILPRTLSPWPCPNPKPNPNPSPNPNLTQVSMRLQQMEVSCETKTKDNVFVLIRVAVQYQVNDDEESIKNAHYRLTNPKQQIESYVFDVVRSSVPKIDLDDVFTTKEEIAQNIKGELTSAMSSFGYTILASPITDIDPDKEVKRAMNDINKAKRLRLAAQDRQLDRTTHPPVLPCAHPSIPCLPPTPATLPPRASQDEGEAVKIKAVKEAEAEAARTEIQAKADAEAKFLAGQGIARQRQAIMEGLRESVNAFKNEVQDVDAKTVLDLMIVTQYFDMMRDSAPSPLPPSRRRARSRHRPRRRRAVATSPAPQPHTR